MKQKFRKHEGEKLLVGDGAVVSIVETSDSTVELEVESPPRTEPAAADAEPPDAGDKSYQHAEDEQPD